jgi:hypothetical protein
MPGQQKAGSAGPGRALHYIHPWTIVPLHVEVGRGEMGRPPRTEIPRDRQRLQEDFRHQHGTAPVEHHATLVKIRDGSGKPPEVAVTGCADRGSIGSRMLMDDFSADCGVDGHRHVVLLGRQQDRSFRSR